MIPAIIFAAVAGLIGFLGGSLCGGLKMVDRPEGAENQRDEYQRRLNRILETEQPEVEAHPKLVLLYQVARGARI